jgi:hypothetical protein
MISRMDRTRERKLRDEYLLTLYRKQKAVNFGGPQSNEDLCRELGIEYNGEATQICQYLKGRGWIEWPLTFAWVNITIAGREKAEGMDNERFEEKLNRLFQLLYNERHNRHTKQFVPDELAAALDLDVPEVIEIISILNSKGWLGGNDEGVNINAAGILEFERRGQPPAPATNVMYINQNYAPVAQGSNFTQSVTQIRNEFDDSIHKLLHAVEESRDLSPVQKITVRNDINMVHQLAHMEKTPEVIETASTKIDSINSIVSSTADIVSLGVVVIPMVRAFFGL